MLILMEASASNKTRPFTKDGAIRLRLRVAGIVHLSTSLISDAFHGYTPWFLQTLEYRNGVAKLCLHL